MAKLARAVGWIAAFAGMTIFFGFSVLQPLLAMAAQLVDRATILVRKCNIC